MNTPNIFSVILLVHNNLEYLPEAIDSVLSQDYPAIELIIADDYSDSFDSAAVEAYLAAHGGSNLMRALVYQNPENLGTVRNFNRAVGQARGAYLKGLAADDALYAPNVLSQAQRALDDSSDGIIASRVMRCSQRMKPLALFRDRFLRSLDCRSSQEIWKALCVHNELPSTGIFLPGYSGKHMAHLMRAIGSWRTGPHGCGYPVVGATLLLGTLLPLNTA